MREQKSELPGVLGFAGAVLDLDGVITQTAAIHFKAWKGTFDDYLKEKRGSEARPFTHEGDYIPYVDGKPRYDGVASFLKSRGIELPYGDPKDEAGKETICGIGNEKNARFQKLVETDEVEVFTSTIQLVDTMKEAGVAVGVASSSRNCTYILEKTGLLPKFETVVDGNVSRELGLKGKPEPDIFVTAAEQMGVSPYDSLMVEDAYSGVEAGWRGGFGLVIGVARSGDKEGLFARGADVVVGDMSEISPIDITAWFREGRQDDGWKLSYRGFNADDDRLREALTTVGNGFFATRGVLESEDIDDNRHYPGTYIAGLFNRATTEVHGNEVSNNALVNCPNWVKTTVRADGSDVLSPRTSEVLSYHQWLDMRRAVLHRAVTYRDEKGRETRLETRRFASMKRRNVGALQVVATPLNHADPLIISTELDGEVRNYGVERYRDLEQHHLEPVRTDERPDGSFLLVRTLNSDHEVAMRSRSRLSGAETPSQRSVETKAAGVQETFTVKLEAGKAVTLEKVVAICSDLDPAAVRDYDSVARAAEEIATSAPGFDQLEEEHAEAWTDLWETADITIVGDRFAQRAVRLHAYHLLTTASPQTIGLDVGLPARGLHGEAYRGHIFWDELFIMPFYLLRFPEVAKNHLIYRYRRLEKARELAKEEGYQGAMYPWQSADTGEPESQQLHYNPRSGEWDPDLSNLQRHIGISIGYDVFTYYYVTRDEAFINEYGLPMLIEISRFWASIAALDDSDGRYHIAGVMGPDEFHEKYPEAARDNGGFRDNAYTNVMACWLMHKTVETFEHRPTDVQQAVAQRLDLDESEMDQWKEITERMALVMDKDGLMSQFEGFRDLEELDWESYRRKYGNIRRMDRILKAEDDSPDRYQVIKQADVLMMFYLLAPGQVSEVIRRMGYSVTDPTELLRTNFEYYAPRTSHGSTLSWVVHAAILEYLDTHEDDQWNWFVECLKSDIFDTQGGTTLEGIHCGVMSGSIDMIISRLAGLQIFRDHFKLDDPELPDGWRRLSFNIRHADQLIEIELDRSDGSTVVAATRKTDGSPAISLKYGGSDFELPLGERVVVDA